MRAAHPPPVGGERLVEGLGGTGLGCAAEPEHAGHPPAAVAIGRHRVHLALVLELHDVLDAAQEAVGVVEARRVGGVDVAAAAQVVEGGERAASAELVVDAAVHELEQLHGELDVADAAGPVLHVAVAVAAGRPPPRPGP